MVYSQKAPHGIMFHHFHNARHIPSQGSLSEQDFDKILNYIGIERFLSPEEWLERIKKKTLREGDLCLTFDDGLLAQAEVALPVLEHYRLQAFWFVYSSVFEGQIENLEIYRLFRTKYFSHIDEFYKLFFQSVIDSNLIKSSDFVLDEKAIQEQRRLFPFYSENDIQFRFLRDKALGKQNYEKIMDLLLERFGAIKPELAKDLWMSNDNLKYLSGNNHIIGLHSYNHPTAIASLSSSEQLEEYQRNYRHLEKVCGPKPVVVSHPCNSYNEDTLEILNQLGIYCGFRANMFPAEPGGRLNANNLEIAREDHANLI